MEPKSIDWLTHSASAVGAATLSLGIAYFWLRRQNNRFGLEQRDGARQERQKEDSDTIAGWRQLMEFKSDDFRKRQEESDKRVATMIAKMDLMHAAHQECERTGMMREIEYKRAGVDRDIEIRDHKLKIEELQRQIESMRASVTAIAAQQVTQGDRQDTQGARQDAATVASVSANTTALAELKEKEARHDAKSVEQAAVFRRDLEQLKNPTRPKDS